MLMKKSTIGVLIAAAVMIVAGIGLCIGGVMAAGGMEAAKDMLYGSGVDFDHVFELDEDGFDIDFELEHHETVHH